MPLSEYNDVTRLTRAQLADRIRQMETTAARNSQLGAPNDRHRPMEDRRRREKIALYTEELRRREMLDAAESAAQAERDERAARQSARDLNRNMRALGIDPDWRPEPTPAPAEAEPPAEAAELPETPAPSPAAREFAAARAIEAREDPRLQVKCIKCGAAEGEACRNYKGQRCAPHSGRKPGAPIPEQPTPDASDDGSQAEREPAPGGPDLGELRSIVASLVRRHGCGAVIDAAWDANTARWQAAGQQRHSQERGQRYN